MNVDDTVIGPASAGVSVVVVAHNSSRTIRRCLATVFQSDLRPVDVVVVDNASTDGTAKIVASSFPQVPLVTCRRNLGFGLGCNLGAKWARGSWLLFINPDCVVCRLDSRLFDEALANEELGAVGLLVRESETAAACTVASPLPAVPAFWFPAFRYSWAMLLPRRLDVKLLAARTHVFRLGGRGARAKREWLPGTALAVRRRAWDDIGGFDGRFFLYWEDVDLSERLKRAGWRLASSAAVELTHVGGESFRETNRGVRTAWGVAGWVTYVEKWSGRGRAQLGWSLLRVNLTIVRTVLGFLVRVNPSLGPKIDSKELELANLRAALAMPRNALNAPSLPSPGVQVARALGRLSEKG